VRDEESTLASDDWPVAPQYQVTPDPSSEDAPEDERAAVAVAPPGRDWIRLPPRAAVALALVALLVLLAAAGAWLATSFDESSGKAARSPQPRAGATHSNQPPPATTGPSTETETDSTTTTSTAPRRRIAVPSVVGLSPAEAARKIREAGLRPETRVVTSSRPTGTVVAQDPSPGSKLERGDVVELEVANAPQPATVRMPRLVGLTASDAKHRLRALGLHWTITETTSSEGEGTVVGQAPGAGANVRKSATVSLRTSAGPASITVPDVTGLDEASARTQLESAGFDVKAVDEPTADPSEDGTVVNQDPVGGAEAEKGSVVTITVARLS
jgi:beta-lactam-binding protein with PASTA domain